MSTEIQTENKSVRQKVLALFESPSMQAALEVCPPWIDKRQFAALAASYLAEVDLGASDLARVVREMLRIASMGMYPGPAKHVHIVARHERDKDRNIIGTTFTAQPQWQGWKFLFLQGGWEVTAHVVVHGDEFEFAAIGPDEHVVTRHTYPDPFGRVINKETFRGVYAKGKHIETGEVRYHIVTRERFMRAYDARAGDKFWTADFPVMAQKVAFHQAASRRAFPVAADVQAAITMAERVEFGDGDAPVALPKPTVPQQLKTVRLPSLPQLQPQPEVPAVDVDFANPEEGANV